MKTIKIKFILSIILIVMGISCSENWLDIEQKGAIAQENFFTTDEECLQALVAVYDVLQAVNTEDWNSPYMARTLITDEVNCGGGHSGDQIEYQEINLYTHTAANQKMSRIWMYYYFAIYRANVVIANVEPINDARAVMVAEAKALRAYVYFELVNLFGSVPLVTEIFEDPAESVIPKSTVEQIYAQMEQDLSDAITGLKAKAETDPWRIAKGFAQAFMGKVLVWQEKYSEALPYLNAVINSGEYSLVDDYERILRNENEYGDESLFELGYTSSLGWNWDNHPWGDGRAEENNIHWQLIGPRAISGGENIGMLAGWGFIPAKEAAFNLFHADDPRRAYNVLSEDELDALGVSIRDDVGELGYQHEGYLRLKYGTWEDETTQAEGEIRELNYGTNFRVMRYAEVLLLAAEAHLGVGDGAAAAVEINKVRARPNVDYTPLASATWDDLKYERTVELCFEGHRYYDLVRWGDALEVLAPYGFQAKHTHFPIPQDELDANPNLVQNDPWR